MTEVPTSCGVLVLATTGEILLGHSTGGRHWDIFKGLQEPDETVRVTALRELREESGLTPQSTDLMDLGRFDYLPRKELHLFAMTSDRLAISSLNCTSTFVDRFGRRRPGMDAFDWMLFDQVPQRCGKGMTRVLTTLLLTVVLTNVRGSDVADL